MAQETINLDHDPDYHQLESPSDESDFLDSVNTKSASEEPREQPFSEERQDAIHKITQYKEAFPASCALVELDSLKYMSEDELDEYLQRIRFSVSTKNCGNFIGSSINGAIYFGEKLGTQYYPQIKGLHADLNAKKEYHDLLTEISIEYSQLRYIPPEYRLLMLVGGTAIQRINTPIVAQKKIDNGTASRYSDL